MKLLAAIVLALAGCGGGGDGGCSVAYEVIGSNSFQTILMMFALPGGGTGQVTANVYPKAFHEEYHFKSGEVMSISGRNTDDVNSEFEVRIIVDGRIRARSEGFSFSTASAKYTCP